LTCRESVWRTYPLPNRRTYHEQTSTQLRLAPSRRHRDLDDQSVRLPAPLDGPTEVVLYAAFHQQRAEARSLGRDDGAIAAAFPPGQPEHPSVDIFLFLHPIDIDLTVGARQRTMLRGVGRKFVEQQRHRDERIFGKQEIRSRPA